MIITLSGITGVGKSYFKRCIIRALNFKNIIIITTRKKRRGERHGLDKYFLTEEQFQRLQKNGTISVAFEFLGNKYAYYTKDLLQTENSITELHYDTVKEFKKVAKDVISIYIKPMNIEVAKKQLKKRKLPKDVEITRLTEIEEQVIEFEKNKDLQQEFDYVFYNDYTKESTEKMLEFINDRIKEAMFC